MGSGIFVEALDIIPIHVALSTSLDLRLEVNIGLDFISHKLFLLLNLAHLCFLVESTGVDNFTLGSIAVLTLIVPNDQGSLLRPELVLGIHPYSLQSVH